MTEDLESLVSSLENKSPLDCGLMWKDTMNKESFNKCLFEVVERLECILDNEGTISDSRVTGTVYANCDIEGNAEASVTFKSIFPITDFSLHKDVILAKGVDQFKNGGILRFYPSGSSIELLKYIVESPPIALPFSVSYNLVAKFVRRHLL